MSRLQSIPSIVLVGQKRHALKAYDFWVLLLSPCSRDFVSPENLSPLETRHFRSKYHSRTATLDFDPEIVLR